MDDKNAGQSSGNYCIDGNHGHSGKDMRSYVQVNGLFCNCIACVYIGKSYCKLISACPQSVALYFPCLVKPDPFIAAGAESVAAFPLAGIEHVIVND